MSLMRSGILAAVTVSICLTSAPLAHADPASEFLAQLSEHGFDTETSGTDTQILLANGETVCSFVHYGRTPEQARRYLSYQYPDNTPEQLVAFVDAAQATLCEANYAPPLPRW